MKIRLSRYNAPFTETPIAGVHFISLDDQRLMRSGHFSAHVEAYLSERYSVRRIYSPHHVPFKPYSNDSDFLPDSSYLEDLYYVHGINAAGRALGRRL